VSVQNKKSLMDGFRHRASGRTPCNPLSLVVSSCALRLLLQAPCGGAPSRSLKTSSPAPDPLYPLGVVDFLPNHQLKRVFRLPHLPDPPARFFLADSSFGSVGLPGCQPQGMSFPVCRCCRKARQFPQQFGNHPGPLEFQISMPGSSLRVDDERPRRSNFYPGVNPVLGPDFFPRGPESMGYRAPPIPSSRFPLLPVPMVAGLVHADREDFDAIFLKGGVLDGNCRHFGRSDIGEIGPDKKTTRPTVPVIGQTDRFHLSQVIRPRPKNRGLFSI